MGGRTVWFPGHMAKGRRALLDLASKLDVIIEVRDARAPRITSSPMAEELATVRPVWVVLGKRDLAEEAGTRAWMAHFDHLGVPAWALNLLEDRVEPVKKALAKASPPHREARVAVVGVPNVGKSQFLNQLLGGSRAQVGGIPGVTKGVNWFRVGGGLLVVDSPGILDPRADISVQRALGWLGSSKGEVIGGYEMLACDLLRTLRERGRWDVIERTWGVPLVVEETDEDDLERIGRRLGSLAKGGVVDRELAGRRLFEAFSKGKMGRLTLELPMEGCA